jgi:acetylglutamate kinase
MMDSEPVLIKIGGHEIGDHEFLSELAVTISQWDTPVVIVHGGGAEITHLQGALGIEPRYIDGLRITDLDSLAVVEMVLCGTINKRLVRYLVNAGVNALGMCGVDLGIIRASQMQHPSQNMAFTGRVESARGDVLAGLLAQGITPVIAPLCLGDDGPVTYNVNADHVAGAVAAAVQASHVVFLTNVEGVLNNGQVVPRLDTAGTQKLIDDGTISGGMIPKVLTALSTLENGIPHAVITNLDGLKSHGGTVFTRDGLSVSET